MKVEVNTDKPVTDATLGKVVSAIQAKLARHSQRLTRAQVYLKNIGSDNHAQLLDCTLEVRPSAHDPVVASNEAASLEEAVAGAAAKMERQLESLFARLDSIRGGASASGQTT